MQRRILHSTLYWKLQRHSTLNRSFWNKMDEDALPLALSSLSLNEKAGEKVKEKKEIDTIALPCPSGSPYKKLDDIKSDLELTKTQKDFKTKSGSGTKNKEEKVKNLKNLETRLSDIDLTVKPSHSVISKRYASTDASITNLAQVINQIKDGRIKNVIVMSGAGISTKSGIPDFRSPETGLYANLQRFNLEDPCDVFDWDFFLTNPHPFFELAKELYPSGKYLPNEAHYFIKILHDKGVLKKLYTQNIDGLERAVNIPEGKLIEAHGTFATATCIKCKQQCKGSEIKEKILAGEIPRCHMKANCNAVIKPDIVFFGEDLPRRFFNYVRDFNSCDFLIIMGTSLQVQPFADIIDSVPNRTPRLLLNRDKVGPFKKCKRKEDFVMAGDLSTSTRKLLKLLGWENELDEYLNEQKLQQSLENEKKEAQFDKSDTATSAEMKSRN